MKKRWDFFKENDSSFGLFYPSHYVVAGFETHERAKEVCQAFLDAGFAEDEVAAASGPFVMNHVESQDQANWIDRMEAEIARVVGTESGYISDDIKLARRGGAFVFAYAPNHRRLDEACAVLKRVHPIFARHYNPMGVVSLHYPPQSTL